MARWTKEQLKGFREKEKKKPPPEQNGSIELVKIKVSHRDGVYVIHIVPRGSSWETFWSIKGEIIK